MLHHVGIEVSPAAIERTAELFQLLGFELVQPPESLSEFTWLERGGTQIHLMPIDSPTIPPRSHMAIIATDFNVIVATLQERGFEVENRREHWGSPRARTSTPDGHRIELLERGPQGDPFIAVAGNIATGKSGLVERLATGLSTEPLLEDVTQNPFFDRFYHDPKRWAFASQVAFATDSLQRHIHAATQMGPAVQDRTVFETVDVFARLLWDQSHLTSEDFNALSKFLACAERLPRQPSVLVYLHAPVKLIMSRIANRGRPAERDLTFDYLSHLERRYETFVEQWSLCPVIEVDTSLVDLRDEEQVNELAKLLTNYTSATLEET